MPTGFLQASLSCCPCGIPSVLLTWLPVSPLMLMGSVGFASIIAFPMLRWPRILGGVDLGDFGQVCPALFWCFLWCCLLTVWHEDNNLFAMDFPGDGQRSDSGFLWQWDLLPNTAAHFSHEFSGVWQSTGRDWSNGWRSLSQRLPLLSSSDEKTVALAHFLFLLIFLWCRGIS